MKCPICNHRDVKGKNKTCADPSCRTVMARDTRSENDLHEELALRRALYGRDNEWVKWMEQAMEKRQ